MTRTVDRIKALEAAFAPQPDRWAEFVSPVPDLSPEQWEEIAMRQQAHLIATGKDDIDRAAAREAEHKAAELAATQPPARQRKHKPPPTFTPSVFDHRA